MLRALRRQSNWLKTKVSPSALSSDGFILDKLEKDGFEHNLLFAKLKDGSISCLSSVCSHRPVVMEKAQRHEDELRCHCHGAIFDIKSGAVRCAPALKPLQKYKIRMDNDSIEVDLDHISPQYNEKSASLSENVVIIGGGAAGAAAAESLASSGMSVNVLSKEAAAGPYDRTLISKRFAEVPLTKEINENISYLSNTEVLSIDPKAKTLRIKRILPDPNKVGCGPKKKWTFEEMSYTKLIVATGMRPRYLPGQSSGITVYNSSDAERLQELVADKRVTVVGGSYLGVETAANLVMLKKKNKLESMTLVIGENHPLSTSYGDEIGKVVRKKLEDFGIEILSNSIVSQVDSEKLIFEDGSDHSYGALIQCIGGIPVTDFLPEEIKFCGNLVSVSTKFQTSCEDIYAVGDCVKIDGVSYNPHWAAAQEMGKAAATDILTGNATKLRQTMVWSSFGKVHLRSVGARADDSSSQKHYFDEEIDRYITAFLDKNGHVIGCVTINGDPVCAQVANLLEIHDHVRVEAFECLF